MWPLAKTYLFHFIAFQKASFGSAFPQPYSLSSYRNFWHQVFSHWMTFQNANFIMPPACLKHFPDVSLLLERSKEPFSQPPYPVAVVPAQLTIIICHLLPHNSSDCSCLLPPPPRSSCSLSPTPSLGCKWQNPTWTNLRRKQSLKDVRRLTELLGVL